MACRPRGDELAGQRFRGIERADSVTLDAHKWLFLPKACGVSSCGTRPRCQRPSRTERVPAATRTASSTPLDTTLEYSRPFRALKLWLAFRVHGAQAFRTAVERNIEPGAVLAEEIRRHDDLQLLGEPQLSIVPFRHAPPGVDLDAHNRRARRRSPG